MFIHKTRGSRIKKNNIAYIQQRTKRNMQNERKGKGYIKKEETFKNIRTFKNEI